MSVTSTREGTALRTASPTGECASAQATICASALHGFSISATEWSRVVGDLPFAAPCAPVAAVR